MNMLYHSKLRKMFKPSKLLHGWIIFGLSALFMFYKNAIEVSPSVMTKELMAEFSISATSLGSLAASYFYAYLIMQIPAGFLIDRFGPKKITTIAIFICALGSMLFSQSNSVFVASIGRFMTGVGASFAAMNCIKLLTNWFAPSKLAFMVGLMMTIGMLGAVGGQAPLSFLIGLFGWRVAIWAFGLFGIVLAGLFFLSVDDHPQGEAKEVHIAPQKMRFTTVIKQVMGSKQGWLLSLYSGLAFAPISVFGGLWGVPFLSEFYQISSTAASHSVSLIFIGFAVGAPLSGFVSDRLKSRLIVMKMGTIIALLAILLALYLPPYSIYILNGCLFVFGAAISGFLVCFTMIREINKPILAATAVGFMNAFDAFFGAFSDPLTGYFLDASWSGATLNGAHIFSLSAYQNALAILPIYLFLSIITVYFIKETFHKPSQVENFP
jgi:sugar phosphate permease